MVDMLSLEFDVKGHSDSITCLGIAENNPNIFISGSRDKSIMVWELIKTDVTTNINKEIILFFMITLTYTM